MEKKGGGGVLKQEQGEATVCVYMSPALWADNSFIYVFMYLCIYVFIYLSWILTALLAHLYRDMSTVCSTCPQMHHVFFVFFYKLSFRNILATDCTLMFHQWSVKTRQVFGGFLGLETAGARTHNVSALCNDVKPRWPNGDSGLRNALSLNPPHSALPASASLRVSGITRRKPSQRRMEQPWWADLFSFHSCMRDAREGADTVAARMIYV